MSERPWDKGDLVVPGDSTAKLVPPKAVIGIGNTVFDEAELKALKQLIPLLDKIEAMIDAFKVK